MNRMVKNLMVVLVAALMFFTSVLTPVHAESASEEPAETQTEVTDGNGTTETVGDDPAENKQTETTGDVDADPAETVGTEPTESVGQDTLEPAEDGKQDIDPVDTPADGATEEESAADADADSFDVADLTDDTVIVDAVTASQVANSFSFKASSNDDVKIAASKSVTDEDEDGIYDLKLRVTGTSNKTQSETLYKSNVVLVIDVSGSMGDGTIKTNYTYSRQTYDGENVEYYGLVNGVERRVYYSTDYRSWYYTNTSGNWQGWFSGQVYTYEGPSRLTETKAAAKELVAELLKNNKPGETDKDNIVEISVIKFASLSESTGYYDIYGRWHARYYNGTEVLISGSTSETEIDAVIDGLVAGGGTNWEAALRLAKEEVDDYTIQTIGLDGKTKVVETNNVIFLTDGVPTLWVNNDGTEGGTGYEGAGNEANVEESFNQAYPYADDLVNTAAQEGTDCTFYSIFAYGKGDTGINYLRRLTNYAYDTSSSTNTAENKHCFDATDTTKLKEAFSKISDKISSNVGFGGVDMSDGLSVGSTNSTIAVDGTVHPEYFLYTVYDEDGETVLYTVTYDESGNATFKDANGLNLTPVTKQTVTTTLPNPTEEDPDGTKDVITDVYSVTVGAGADAKTYMMTPATIGTNGMIDWNLAGLGILEKWTYELSFKVWPNQAAYDIASDLNNGLYNGNLETAINDYVKNGKITQTEGERLKTTMTKDSSGLYVVSTNYSQEVTYHQAEITQEEGSDPVTVYQDPQSDHITPEPKPIPLKGSLIPMEKRWGADLAISELQELVFGKNKTYTNYKVVLKLQRDGKDYMTYTFPKLNDDGLPVDKNGAVSTNVEELVWSQDAAIAPGTLVTKNPGGGTLKTVNLTGEKATAAGVEGTYYIVNEGHRYTITEEEGSDLHFEFEADDYHPMIVDGQLMNIKFNSVGTDGKITDQSTAEVIDPNMTSVYVTNTLKGGLNIRKVVTGEDKTTEVADCTDEFTFEITVTKDGEPYGTPSDQYSIEKPAEYDEEDHGGWSYDEKHNFYYKSGFSAYNIYSGKDANGDRTRLDRNWIPADGKLKLTMPANGEIRVVNLPSGTEYTVKEVVDPNSNEYTYFKTVSKVKTGDDGNGNDIFEKEQNGVDDQGEPIYADIATESTDNEVSGQIVGNKAKVEIYYNAAASFYVYHSSDNTIEKISFADKRVTGKYDAENGYTYTFNIVDETKDNYLYGGYYKAYKNAKVTNDQINGIASEGKLVYTKDETTNRYWSEDTNGTAYDAKKANIWVSNQAYTENVEKTGGGTGTAMTPVVNGVYYLKEVPNGYLRPYIHFTYDDYREDKPIKKLYLITATDDQNYKNAGFMIAEETDITPVDRLRLSMILKKPNGKIEASLAVKSIWNNKTYHGDSVTLTRGYMAIQEYSQCIGKGVTFRPAWTTYDGVLVKGVTVRKVSDGTSANKDLENYISVTDTEADAEQVNP